ncbi:zinc finger MYM-type protein 1 [Trichonephila clavipes]|nr:zinc finger MYM-type protein 1 [Trichonephila clavipes]
MTPKWSPKSPNWPPKMMPTWLYRQDFTKFSLNRHYNTQVVKEGCCDWKDLSRILQRHEQSQGHMECMIKWMEFYKGIKHGKTIDKDNESLIKESQKVKQAKYYAFLLDCTRDVSRVEQMSIILRFCNSSTGAIEKHFVGFIAFAETTGEYITNSILQELDRNGLDIQNCRGQGYDNGANMVCINKGVRTSILKINPRAFFTPCGFHSCNLLLIDAAKSSATAKTFFGFINKIYVLFSKSSKRWDIVKTKLKLTLKPLSETRWESRIGAVKAIFLQFDDISKLWQSVQVNLKVAIDTLRSFCSWIQEFRNTEFDNSVAQAHYL